MAHLTAQIRLSIAESQTAIQAKIDKSQAETQAQIITSIAESQVKSQQLVLELNEKWETTKEEVKIKTAQQGPGNGLWQFNVMPFGLCNAPATFERLMERILVGLLGDACLV